MHPAGDRKTAVFGEFHSHKKTEAERLQDGAIAMALEMRKDITPELLMRDVPNIHAMPRKGTKIETTHPLAPSLASNRGGIDRYGSVFEAKRAIADDLRMNLGDLPGWMMEEVDAALLEGLEKVKVKQISRYVGGFLQKQAV